jgi:hypothetical protein
MSEEGNVKNNTTREVVMVSGENEGEKQVVKEIMSRRVGEVW